MKKYNLHYKFVLLLFTIFCLMRIYRNSFNHDSVGVGGLWNIISLIFLLMSFFIILGFVRGGRITYSIKIAFIYSFVSIFNSIILLEKFNLSNFYNILMIAFFPSVFVVFFIMGGGKIENKEKKLTENCCFLIVLLAFLAVFLFKTNRIGFVMVSVAYYPICLVPLFLFFNKNKEKRYIFMILVLGTILFSGKRTGLLAFMLFLVVYLLGNFRNNKNIIKKINKIIIPIIVFILFITIIYPKLNAKFDINIVERIFNLSKDKGSGRLIMYFQLINAMKKASLKEWLLGHGCNTTGEVLIVHDTAHNDFLEILYDYGVISLLLFFLFYCFLLREYRLMKKTNYIKRYLFLGEIIISLFMSCFSTYCVSFGYVICGMASLGIILGDWKKNGGILSEINYSNYS